LKKRIPGDAKKKKEKNAHLSQVEEKDMVPTAKGERMEEGGGMGGNNHCCYLSQRGTSQTEEGWKKQ